MKARGIAILGLCAIAGTVLVFTAGADSDRDSADALLQRVKSLEKRVADLEKRLQEQEKKGSPVIPRLVPPKGELPEAIPPMGELPEGWQKRYFNGQPDYIVPVQPEAGATVRPAR